MSAQKQPDRKMKESTGVFTKSVRGSEKAASAAFFHLGPFFFFSAPYFRANLCDAGGKNNELDNLI